jgi:hypothetical protein
VINRNGRRATLIGVMMIQTPRETIRDISDTVALAYGIDEDVLYRAAIDLFDFAGCNPLVALGKFLPNSRECFDRYRTARDHAEESN